VWMVVIEEAGYPVLDKAYPGGAALATSTASPHGPTARRNENVVRIIAALLEHFSAGTRQSMPFILQLHRMLLEL
jgi:hypothetical protein